MTTIWWSFYFVKHPDENRRFDTIVGKNKRNALRAVRTLRVVSATNNPSGAATMSSRAIYRDASGMPRRAMPERNRQMTRLGHFICFPILSSVRKLGIKNTNHFTHLRTFL